MRTSSAQEGNGTVELNLQSANHQGYELEAAAASAQQAMHYASKHRPHTQGHKLLNAWATEAPR